MKNKAYWLGFIMADGCITKSNKNYPPDRFHICLKSDEVKFIDKFKKDIECDYETKIRLIQNKKRDFESYICELRINSKIFVSNLIKHGICLNKTGKEIIPDTIPKHLIRHFIRGYFDGDGSITNKKAFRVCSSSETILKQIVSYFESSIGVSFKIYCSDAYKKPFYTIDSRHHGHNKLTLDLLYRESNVYLDRKHDRYIEYFCPTTK